MKWIGLEVKLKVVMFFVSIHRVYGGNRGTAYPVALEHFNPPRSGGTHVRRRLPPSTGQCRATWRKRQHSAIAT